MSDFREPLREAVNVPDEIERDRIIRRFQRTRAYAASLKADVEDWNRRNPDKKPFDTCVEDAIIAFCDGKGPFPTTVLIDGKRHAWVDGELREIPI